jgi:hypothetical protein
MTTKTCYICKKEKDTSNFGKLSSSKDGLRYGCKEEYNSKNRDKKIL